MTFGGGKMTGGEMTGYHIFYCSQLDVLLLVTGTGGCLAWFTGDKNSESQIMDIKISFSQILEISK